MSATSDTMHACGMILDKHAGLITLPRLSYAERCALQKQGCIMPSDAPIAYETQFEKTLARLRTDALIRKKSRLGRPRKKIMHP